MGNVERGLDREAVERRAEAARSDAPLGTGATTWRWAYADDVPALLAALRAAEAEAKRLRALLTDLVVAADRLRDDWAESDAAVRRRLWKALHAASDQASDEVYPLRTEGGAS